MLPQTASLHVLTLGVKKRVPKMAQRRANFHILICNKAKNLKRNEVFTMAECVQTSQTISVSFVEFIVSQVFPNLHKQR